MMKSTGKQLAFLAAFLSSIVFSHNAIATLIGTLELDVGTGVISDTASSTTYLDLSVLAHLTYAETITATSSGGSHEEWHIASQTEAYAFFHALGGVGIDNPGNNFYLTVIGAFTDGILGDNYDHLNDYAFFLSDVDDTEVGSIVLTGSAGVVLIDDTYGTFNLSNLYSSPSNLMNSWLLVGNSSNSSTSVTEPNMVVLMSLALTCLLGCRRRNSANRVNN